NLKAFIIVGFLGGFTTFSAFSIDVLSLIMEKQYFTSMLYISLTFIFSLSSVFLGFLLSRLIIDS
ncbi:MAG: CrcB family protein, partial [Pseudomonadota bacterium]|nr:CrcB family protein [Pseudomonadota bacterium]MEC9458509.1 CrcB family protein [Pseudomonadota bacterium]